jgi:hypothetical protein
MEATQMTKIQKAKSEVTRLWNLMCVADGILPTSKFVVFSDSNPHTVAYNKAVKVFFRLKMKSSLHKTVGITRKAVR